MSRLTYISVAVAGSIVSAGVAQATVTPYTSAAQFAAAATIQHAAGLEAIPLGRFYAPFTDDGVAFVALGQDFYGVAPGQALTNNPNTFPTKSLSADGDENFQISLASGASFNAFGLDYATNAYGAPTLSLYTVGGTLIETVTVLIPPDTVGFFGLISSTPIGFVRTTVDRGYIADTAIDNVRIGTADAQSGVPEPASWAMMIAGFGLVGGAARRARATVAFTG